jgi:anaerobic magnesium-protoporphyrin IX monomethyl ester cyclase
MRDAALAMIRHAKEAGCEVIVSGSDSTDHFKKYLDYGADFVLIGEAEYSLLELLQALQTGAGFEEIKGIAFKKDGEYVRSAARPVIRELDRLPFPAWDLVDIEDYRNCWLAHAGFFSINIGTTRGCPYKCNWCAKPIYGNRYNARSPENVVEELKLLQQHYGFDHVWFCDDIFGLKPGWVKHFADLAEKEKLAFRFKIQSRADLLSDEEYVQSLARAGCKNVWIGAESGSQKILDAMDKGIRVEQIREATTLVRKYGMEISFFIQFGYPGEMKEDIDQTISMITDLLPDQVGISVSYPLPGTKFHEKVHAELKEKSNWTDSDELMLMFKNTFSPEFYKKLYRYAHHNLRKHHGIALMKKAAASPLQLNRREWKVFASTFWYASRTFIDNMQLKKYASR